MASVLIILVLSAVLSYTTKKITLAGAFIGLILALCIWQGEGYAGLLLLGLFFVTGTLATGWQKAKKHIMNTGKQHPGQRTAGQVIANGGMAAILSLIAWMQPSLKELMLLMLAGSFASATADTLSSELGTVYGRRFYNVINFKTDKRGLDGVISIEGTVIGIGGAVIIAATYALFTNFGATFIYIVFAGALGNLIDSVLGATLERRGIIHNNTVNFLNTLAGALICLLFIKAL